MAGNWFHFRQNNSGGSFRVDDKSGIGPNVWIEADDAEHANYRAGRIGIYFDGIQKGMDCECCGDRWYAAWRDEGEAAPEVDEEYHFSWHDIIYAHHRDGTIERIKKNDAPEPETA